MKNFILSVLQIKENNIDFTHTAVEEVVHKGIKSLFITAKLTYEPPIAQSADVSTRSSILLRMAPGHRELHCRIFPVCPLS